jgi:hypothetical protein
VTAPQSFEVEEAEGTDLGQVAGVKRRCTRCGGDSWTGEMCTACMVALETRAVPSLYALHVGAPAKVVEQGQAEQQRPPEWVREQPASCPAPLRSLERAAEVAGWRTHMVWSRGWEPKGAHVEVITVRFAHPRTRRGAFASYRALVRPEGAAMTWAWDCVYVWGPDLPPFGGCGVTELKHYLAHQAGWDEVELDEWVTGVRGGRQDAAEAKKQRDADRKWIKDKHRDGAALTDLACSETARRQGWTVEDLTKITAPPKRNKKSEEAS